MGQQDRRAQEIYQVRSVECCRSGGVSCGSADGQKLADLVRRRKIVDKAQRAGHSSVLERCAGVESVVLEEEVRPHLFLQPRVRFHQRSVPFAQVDDLIQGNHRRDELVVSEDPLERLHVQHSSEIKNPSPPIASHCLQAILILVLQHQDAAALRAGVQKPVNVQFTMAPQAPINHFTLGLREEEWSYVFGKLIQSHDTFL